MSVTANQSFYCPAGDRAKSSCGTGYYSLLKASTTFETGCEKCPPGFYCENSASSAKFQSCPAGYV